MLDPELLRRTLKQTLSRGGDFADVFVERRTPTYLFLEDDRLERAVTGAEGGAGVRLVLGEKTFMALTSDLSESTLLECASLLSRAASGQSTESTFELAPSPPLHDFPITEPPESVSMERKVELVRAANRAARGFGRHIRQVSVTYRDVIQRVQIAASSGELCRDERIHTLGIVQVVAEGGRGAAWRPHGVRTLPGGGTGTGGLQCGRACGTDAQRTAGPGRKDAGCHLIGGRRNHDS
jgi:TldD protein